MYLGIANYKKHQQKSTNNYDINNDIYVSLYYTGSIHTLYIIMFSILSFIVNNTVYPSWSF